MKERLICNEDCFHCIYPDCIATPKKDIEKKEKLQAYRKKYYQRKKEQLKEYQKKYQQRKKEEQKRKEAAV